MAEDPTSVDAEWKRIQERTMTRWVNEKLKTVDKYVYNVETDFCDGLYLIALLEVLSGKQLGQCILKPTLTSQKLENISLALKFIEDENIQLVNIDASDICKGDLQLILGLLWTLVLKYDISDHFIDEDSVDGRATPKSSFLNWLHQKVPDLPINNFTSDWQSGIAIGALVNAYGADLCTDWKNWDSTACVENATFAMDTAEKWLDVPQVIEPADIINPEVDELSVMTYASQFITATLKPGAHAS